MKPRTALITGSGKNIGRAIALRLARNGFNVVVHGGSDRVACEAVAEAVRACGVDALVTVGDVGNRKEVYRIAEAALAEFGTIDVLIHNAAILRVEPLVAVSLDTFQATLNVGIQAAFQLTKAVWSGMKERGGALVFVSSRSGVEGFAGETAYCAGKHALEGFSKCLALEGASHGILSVTITPGMYMHTPMSETTYPPELREKWVDPILLAPAFSYLATRPMQLSGQRLNAWDLSQEQPAP